MKHEYENVTYYRGIAAIDFKIKIINIGRLKRPSLRILDGDLEATEQISERIIRLPLYNDMIMNDLGFVVESIKGI